MKKFLASLVVVAVAVTGLAYAGYVPARFIPDSLATILKRPAMMADKSWEDGQFAGPLEVRFESMSLTGGTTLELIQLIGDFAYTDSKGLEWKVPAGEISDGASIPWPLWTLVGGPYSGPYRQAAVVHDYYCRIRDRPWRDVHKMFLEAALKAGTGETTAMLMYAGILADGPRWNEDGTDIQSSIPQSGIRHAAASVFGISRAYAQTTNPDLSESCKTFVEGVKDKTDKERFADLKTWIETNKPSLKEVQACVGHLRDQRKQTQ